MALAAGLVDLGEYFVGSAAFATAARNAARVGTESGDPAGTAEEYALLFLENAGISTDQAQVEAGVEDEAAVGGEVVVVYIVVDRGQTVSIFPTPYTWQARATMLVAQ